MRAQSTTRAANGTWQPQCHSVSGNSLAKTPRTPSPDSEIFRILPGALGVLARVFLFLLSEHRERAGVAVQVGRVLNRADLAAAEETAERDVADQPAECIAVVIG